MAVSSVSDMTIAEAKTVSGVADDVLDAVAVELGGPTSTSDWTHFLSSEVEAALTSTTYTTASGTAGTAFSTLDKSRVRAFVAKCSGNSVTTLAIPGVAGLPGLLASAPAGQPALKKTKLSSLVDGTADAEVLLLDPTKVRDMFNDYEQMRGEPPHQDVEPSFEQLSAVAQLIGADAVPYVDFAIFGPHGKRAMKKISHMAYTFLPASGEWKRVEMPGPPCYDTWYKSWLVFECALTLLGTVRTERLRQYSEAIRGYITMYGPSIWPIIYQADVRMRSEQFERIRRAAEIELSRLPPGVKHAFYDPAKPWDGVFAMAIRDNRFWETEVRELAVLWLARVQLPRPFISDDTILDEHSSHPPPGMGGGGSESSRSRQRKGKGGSKGHTSFPPQQPPATKGRQKAKAKGKGKGTKKGVDKANEICNNYNAGKCGVVCSAGRKHACSKCGGPHPVTNCTRG